jgi:hypothetical protein
MPVPETEVFLSALEGITLKVADPQPASTTALHTNTPMGYVSIALPGEGKLWVYFTSQGEPEAKVWLWNQITLFTPIPAHTPTVLASHKGDRLVYELGFPTQQLALTWGYE